MSEFKQKHHAVAALKDEWSPYLSISPILELDDTWPSLGVIDLLTFSLRLQKDVPPSLEPLLTGSAAYLAEIVAKVWRRFTAEVRIEQDADGIVIVAQGGELLPDNATLRCPMETELRRIIEEVPYPFPVFRHFEIPIRFEANIINYFALGVASALGPAVEGPWEGFQPEDEKPWTEELSKELAMQSAAYYGRVFPNEPIGQMAELYLSLTYPPPFAANPLPHVRAAEHLSSLAKEYGFSPGALLKLGRNLALSPESSISEAGLVICGALSTTLPPPEVISVAESKGRYMGLLRAAMVRLRGLVLEKDDWLGRGLTDEDLERFRIEKALGFLPWLYLDPEHLKQGEQYNRLHPVLAAIGGFDLREAINAADDILQLEPGDIPLRIQRVKLEMVGGDIAKADKMLAELISEPEASRYPRLYGLWGQCKLQLNDIPAAKRHFLRELALAERQPHLAADAANNVAWASMLLKQDDEALRYLDQAIEDALCPTTALLNKAALLWELRRYEEAAILRKRLFALAPCDRRVFSSIALNTDAGLS